MENVTQIKIFEARSLEEIERNFNRWRQGSKARIVWMQAATADLGSREIEVPEDEKEGRANVTEFRSIPDMQYILYVGFTQ